MRVLAKRRTYVRRNDAQNRDDNDGNGVLAKHRNDARRNDARNRDDTHHNSRIGISGIVNDNALNVNERLTQDWNSSQVSVMTNKTSRVLLMLLWCLLQTESKIMVLMCL